MNGTKSALKSMTLWGALIMLLPQVAPLIGYTVTEDDAKALVSAVEAIVTAVGGVMVIVGRIRATKAIG
ncbi:MAG: hypothetical protein ACPG4X_16920 [Pikeienuella sp.]